MRPRKFGTKVRKFVEKYDVLGNFVAFVHRVRIFVAFLLHFCPNFLALSYLVFGPLIRIKDARASEKFSDRTLLQQVCEIPFK